MSKQKGSNAERELIALFWKNSWAAHRIAGSGSSRYPSPDIIAGNNLRKLAIESKATHGKRQYVSKEQVEGLMEFSRNFGAEPWIAVRFGREWFFIPPDDMNKTENNLGISESMARLKGCSFTDLISNGH